MNKSKFLKKSLAAVLAVLMVVAMIPLSAAAADPAVVSRVSVYNGTDAPVDATEDGTVWTAKINDPGLSEVTVNVTLANDNATAVVSHEDETGTEDAVSTNAQGVWSFDMTPDEKAAKEAKFTVWDERGAESGKEYTVKFELNEGSNDVSIKSVTVDTQYGETAVDGDTYTITLPYGTATRPALHIVLNNDNAQVTSPVAKKTNGVWVTTDSLTTIDAKGQSETKVTVENGETTHIYTVKTVNATAFAKFSVAGERKEAKIDTENKTVTVYMPYGTKASTNATPANVTYNVTPTFTKGYEGVDVTLQSVTGGVTADVFESGKELNVNKYFTASSAADALASGAMLSGNKTIQLTVKYSDVSTPETWKVTFNGPVNDPAPVLKELTLGTFKATIDETNHTAVLNVPKTLRVPTAKLMGLASPKAKILLTDCTGITAQTMADPTAAAKVINSTDGSTAVDFGIATKNNFIIRVTAAGDEDGANPAGAGKSFAVQDYKLTINTVDTVGKAEITEMVLEDDSDDKNQYKAEIKDNVITFTLPFATTNAQSALNGWKLYYGLSNGTVIKSGGPTAPSGLTLTATTTYFPATFDGTKTTTPIVVTNNESDTSYTVAIKLAPARTARTMTGFKATSVTNFDDIEDNENTFAATGSSDLTVSVPYSKYSGDIVDNPVVSAVVSEGAKVYFVNPANNVLKPVDILAKSGDTANNTLPDVQDSGNEYDGVEKDSAGNLKKLTLVVVNEKGAVDAAGNDLIDGTADTEADLAVGTFTKYTLIIKQADPQKLHTLDSFSVYDSVTKTEIKANVDSRNHKINLTLPASFVGGKTAKTPNSANASGALASGIERNLWFDYGTSHYENVTALDDKSTPAAIGTDGLKKLTIKNGAVVDTDSTAVMTATNTNGVGELEMYDGTTGNETITKIRVESEAYTVNDKGGFQEYDLVVKYADVKLGSALNSVTINGVTAKPDANGKVTVTLPKATEVTGLKPTFSVSDGAFVITTANGTFSPNTGLVQSGAIMNFTQPKTVWVLSEDGANKQKYTIEVKIDDGFSDVKPGDWFYSYVMDASKRGIIIGNGDGTFGPYTNVTRVQFATMMARVDDFKPAEWEGKASQFSDMNGITGEAAAAVAYCADKGYITGDGGATTFRPNATITRQEMAVIISRVMKLNTEDVNIGTPFADDAKIAGWAKNYVYACVNANMLMGEGNNTFNPLGNTIRAAAATAAVRIDNAK